ncbi:hypothetical protein RQP46_007471 [Phenoliferia psychrophenolica]
MGLPSNAAAENALGTIGAVCWSVQLLPQVYKSWKLKNTAGLSSWMLAIWWAGGIFLGTYCVVQNINIPLIVQPQAFGALSIVCWMQCVHYDQGKSWKFAIMMGVGAVVLAGLLPQYYEIYKFKAVKGISLIFLLVDLSGGVFSFLSLVFAEGAFDTLASISYSAVVVLEVGILVLAAILNPRYDRKVAEAKRIDEEALSGENHSPATTCHDGDADLEKKGAQLQAPEMRGRSRDVVGTVWSQVGVARVSTAVWRVIEAVHAYNSSVLNCYHFIKETFREPARRLDRQ